MMRYMRENTAFVLGVIVFVVGAFIGTIFLVYGLTSSSGGSGGFQEGTVIAVVDGEGIAYDEFVGMYNNQVEFYRQFYPGLGLSELEERFQVKEKALKSLINSRLLLAEADRMGIEVSDDELRRKIEGTAIFQEGGYFDPARYRQVLAGSRLSPAEYEESQREEIMIDRVRAVIVDAARVTEAEAWESFRKERDKVRLNLLPLPIETYEGWVSATEEDVRKEFDADPEKYRRPERLRVASFSLRASDLDKDLSASEEELMEYHAAYEERYLAPRQVKASHVLFKAPEGTSPEEEEKLRERADFVHGKAVEGADFSALAKEFSQDASGPEGGGLGYFGRGDMVPAFEEAAFALEVGEVSDVVRSKFGFHVIKVEDIREAGMRPFEEVRAEVEKDFLADEKVRLVSERVEKVNEALFDDDFAAVAAAHGLEVERAERLTREDLLPGLGFRPDVSAVLFALEEGAVSEMYRQESDYHVFLVEGKTASYVPEFDEAEDEVRKDLLRSKMKSRALEESREMVKKLKGGSSLAVVAETVKSEVKATELFGRNDFVPDAGAGGEEFAEAFRLDAGEFGGPVAMAGTVWIFEVADFSAASRDDFDVEKAVIADRLRKEKQDLLFESWVRDLRAIRSVEVDKTLIGS
jgi:peptidyl-prolyl cis-trans isomerase D